MNYISQIDAYIFNRINSGWSNPVFDQIIPWITHLGDSSAVWIYILIAVLIKIISIAPNLNKNYENIQIKKFLFTAGFFFCIYLVLIYGLNVAIFNSLKHLINRPRPFVAEEVVLRVSSEIKMRLMKNGSFPSGHANNAFMAAALFSWIVGGVKRYFFYGIACLVCLSRIYIGVHYPSDVIAGGFLGFSITWIILSIQWLRIKILRENIFPHISTPIKS